VKRAEKILFIVSEHLKFQQIQKFTVKIPKCLQLKFLPFTDFPPPPPPPPYMDPPGDICIGMVYSFPNTVNVYTAWYTMLQNVINIKNFEQPMHASVHRCKR
jgi:hypothetical protein